MGKSESEPIHRDIGSFHILHDLIWFSLFILPLPRQRPLTEKKEGKITNWGIAESGARELRLSSTRRELRLSSVRRERERVSEEISPPVPTRRIAVTRRLRRSERARASWRPEPCQLFFSGPLGWKHNPGRAQSGLERGKGEKKKVRVLPVQGQMPIMALLSLRLPLIFGLVPSLCQPGCRCSALPFPAPISTGAGPRWSILSGRQSGSFRRLGKAMLSFQPVANLSRPSPIGYAGMHMCARLSVVCSPSL